MNLKDKPDSMSIKDFLIKKISLQTKKSEDLITRVISFQFDEANEATNNCNSIEISGFAKIVFNQKRAQRQMEKYNAQIIMYTEQYAASHSENERRILNLKLYSVRQNIEHLKPKLCQN